jgi:hypothetical protein
VTGIINLSSLNKDQIANTLNIDQAKLSKGGLFDNLDGVAFCAFFIVLLVLFLGVGVYFGRNSPKLRSTLLKIIAVVFWNFLIRYF